MTEKRLWLLVLLLLSFVSSYAQVNLKGQVCLDSEDNKAVFAHIALSDLSAPDKKEKDMITDFNGNYILEKVPIGHYVLRISFLGYASVCDTLRVRLPSTGNSIVKNYILMPSTTDIEDIVVSYNTIQQYADKTIYAITRADLHGASHALDLINIVPQLSIDVVTQKITSVKGSVKILINGANASEQELKALMPNQIKSIEYYDFPPARFAGYGVVVNLHTKEIVDGISTGFNLQHAFNTGFGNDGAFFKYNKGKHQISINYNLNYRDYDDVYNEAKYEYIISGNEYIRKQKDSRKFGYSDNYINLSYINHSEDKHLFQINLHPNHQHSHSDGDRLIASAINGEVDDRLGQYRTRTKQFTPSTDIYLWKRISSKNELTFNLVATYHDAENNYNNTERLTDNSIILDDHQYIKNEKTSLIGEVAFSRSLNYGTFNFGNRISWEKMNAHIDNLFNDDSYTTKSLSDYIYGEITGKYKKWLYRLTLGATYTYIKNQKNRQSSWTFVPRVILGYQIAQKTTIRIGFVQQNIRPTLGQLSDNVSHIADNIIQTGNPLLKSGYANETFAGIYYDSRVVTAFIATAYHYSKNPISSYFVEDGNYMHLTYENAYSKKAYGLNYGIRLNLFKNNLITLKLEGNLQKQSVKSRFIEEYDYTSSPLAYEIAVNYKKVTLFYQGNIITYSLDGPYLTSSEKRSNLGLKFRHKNWTGSVLCMWFLQDANYRTKTIASSAVKYNMRNNIKDNASMITLGIAYHFSTGKSYKEKARGLINQDRDSGL